MKIFACRKPILLVGAIIICVTLRAQAPYPDAELDACNITWDEPGPHSTSSMPVGNGDIGLNVWVEPGGDLLFYIAKTDAWGAETRPEWDNWMKTGGVLMKLGAIRLSLNPSLLAHGAPFHQILRLRQGEIAITEGNTRLRIWVDANHPVIRVEADNPQPVRIKLTLDDWRLDQGDTVLSGKGNTLTWYHHNADSADPHLAGRIFGATIEAPGLTRTDRMTLQSTGTAGHTLISIYPLTRPSGNAAGWQTGLRKQMEAIHRLPLEQTRAAHRAWWDGFWRRSWIFLHGDSAAERTTEGYVLQRYVTACAGRGAYPIKFNGSLFVVDNPAWRSHDQPSPMNADFRAWGGQYWFQNTRAMYWPRLQAGDFDMMLPLFAMYRNMLPDNEALVKKYYHHEGAYFQETTPFWGGLPFMGPEQPANYTAHYFTPILELSMMMLDYFDYTGDTLFARDTLLPIASDGIKFFDRHFERDIMAKLLLDPDNAIEMFWKVHDPAPDIAALRAVLSRLIALPDGLAPTELRQRWTRLLGELPPLPTGTNEAGEPILLPYTGPQTAKSFNLENPELYAVYPYRLFGLQKPELELARNTFLHRRFRDKGCWVQDPIQAALLGFTDIAREYTVFNLSRKDTALKFPAFWATGHDYLPDEDNGGNGENALQQMLLQADGRKILLLPAWPDKWDADFRLHAPFHTTIQGKVVHGRLTQLTVTPASRQADVIVKQDPIPFADSKTSWREGYDRFDYLMDEQTEEITPTLATHEEGFGARPAEKGKIRCIVIAPKKAAPGNPWSWRGCYWDHEPQSEVELLRRGFHIAFIMCDPDRHWDAWYAFLTQKHGLSKKSAFSGMSRGGINEFAWATTHPDKVACIYADNPALRPESLARLDVLARHDIPLLHICGSYDFLLREHTLKVEDAYHQLGGRISVIIKEGPGHHPHSLRDPKLIADWVETNIYPDGSRPPAIPGASWDKSYYYSYADTLVFLHPEELYATCRGPLFTVCYDRYDLNTGSDLGITGMTIVIPKKPAPGKPWVFRAQRIWRQPEPVDLALLARGFTIVAAPVTAQAGPLTEQWDEVYRQLTALGFSSKPVLEGAGTAAGEAVYWALANPGKLSCIYSENPILRSLHTPANLTDSLAPLVKAGVPLVQVRGALPANVAPIADSIVASQAVIQTKTGPGSVGVRYPSYTGLVMAGYQGWFNTPGDSTGRHWHHYEHRGVFAPGSCEIDLWPDTREYAKTYPTPFHYADGTQATVFSAYDASTVRLHFKWMKDYGIDGVFMQRFVAEIRNPSGKRHFNTVLDNAMTAAGEYDRAICIMYDLSGMQPGEEQLTLADLDELTAKYDLLNGTRSPTYLHHHGRPLVVVWGVGFNDRRRYGFPEAETLIDGIKSRGFSVMLGVPTWWRTLGRDCLPDSALHRLIRKCDIVAPWFVGRYNEDSYPAFNSLLKDDLVWCKANGVDYAPLAFPGFSWKNMNGPQSTAVPRNRGRFFWKQVAGAREAGVAMLYIAMFDEMNEGTSIFKCNTADRLPLNEGGSFVGIDTDLGSDYYLWLAGQAAAWWHGKDSYSSELPRRPQN